MTQPTFSSQELGDFFDQTTEVSQVPTSTLISVIFTPRQIKRRKEKYVTRWRKVMGAMPDFCGLENGNIPKRTGKNFLDDDGNLKSSAITAIGAKGGKAAAGKQAVQLEKTISSLMEIPEIAACWGNPRMKDFIARRAKVTARTVCNWFEKFPKRGSAK